MSPWWTDAVELEFWAFSDWSDKKVGQDFLDSLARFGFAIKKFGDEDPPRDKFKTSQSLVSRVWSAETDQLILKGSTTHNFEVTVHLNPRKGVLPHSLHFRIDEQYFQRENALKFLTFAETAYSLFAPVYGSIGHTRDRYRKTVLETPIQVSGRILHEEAHISVNPTWGLPGIYWANFLGPKFVSFYSQTKLLAAPVYAKKELSDGGFLILTSSSPLDYPKAETEKLEQDLIEYLGRDTIFDKNSPDRILKSPFLPLGKRVSSPSVKPLSSSFSKPNLRSCPKCGESKNIQELSRDETNDLVGFKCTRCGESWAVHTSLL